ncbi:MAG: UDP-N-acetylmuramoyl-tripeptide--D-alanyl-D-alanine ligase [Bacteroides sp.]|nr:UDP-N-acetylmuramoyl-tripeptide--D-alanyl-D-alanine ligase [Bacteroides sp.]
MSHFIYIASYILFFAALLYSFGLNFVRYMHMFQLNSYHASEQLKWIGENMGEIVKRHFFPLIAALFAVFSCVISGGTLFGENPEGMLCLSDPSSSRLEFVPYRISAWDLLMCTGLMIIGLYFCKSKPAKKKLVFTPRVIRMCAASVIVYGAVCALSLIFLFKSGWALPVLCIWQVCSLFMPMIANLINKPVERGVNNHYINDAKRIINELPNLVTIGITGSYGKTSVKFYLNKLLSAKYNVLMTPESFNTTMGVVKTVRGSLNATYDYFICEMGAKGVGEIKEICDIVKPKHSMITSIGEQHLETFKSVDNIIKTKFEIADCIADGTVFLNYDNEYIKNRTVDKNVVSYGLTKGLDYYADNIAVTVKGTAFTVYHGEESEDFSTRLIGRHNVQNIVGAIAAANTLGVSFAELKAPVRRLEAVPHRMEIIDKGGLVIIDDAFNSNPSGAKAALDTLALMEGFKILVTPGMVELGEREYELNKTFGAQAAAVCDYVIAVGEKQAKPITDGLREAGYSEEKTFVAADLNEALAKCDMLKTGGSKKIILLENDLPDNY